MKTLIVARHGNTFEQHETPTRIGARTDLPLTQAGRLQAERMGRFLQKNNLVPDKVLTSPLMRARQTLETAMLAVPVVLQPHIELFLTEIDYGPDENKTEDKVIERIGRGAIEDWNRQGILPQGWNADINAIIQGWQDLADTIASGVDNVVMAVTSGGIARFAPRILPEQDYLAFLDKYAPKVATGSLSIFQHDGKRWQLREWNLTP